MTGALQRETAARPLPANRRGSVKLLPLPPPRMVEGGIFDSAAEHRGREARERRRCARDLECRTK